VWYERTMEKKTDYQVYANPLTVDGDADGMGDFSEFLNGSDPRKDDTDGKASANDERDQGGVSSLSQNDYYSQSRVRRNEQSGLSQDLEGSRTDPLISAPLRAAR